MSWPVLLLMLASIIIGAFGALFLKKGSHNFHINFNIQGIVNILKNYEVVFGIFLYGISTVFLILALRLGELSVVYPLGSLTYVIISFISVYFLKEKMNLYKWVGIGFIILGVTLVSL